MTTARTGHHAGRDRRRRLARVERNVSTIIVGDKSLKLYTLYGPPNHRDGVVRATKTKAEASEEHFDRKTTEARTPRNKGQKEPSSEA